MIGLRGLERAGCMSNFYPTDEPLSAISRRGFILRSAGVSMGLMLIACTRDQSDTYRALLDADEMPRVLPLREYAILRVLSERIVPGAAALGVAARIDRELALHPERLQRDFRDALRLLEFWPLATRWSRFTRLTPQQQDLELETMTHSRFASRRLAFQALRMLILFFYYTQESTWSAIGYTGPWVERGS